MSLILQFLILEEFLNVQWTYWPPLPARPIEDQLEDVFRPL